MPESPYSTKFSSGEIDFDYDPSNMMKQFKSEEKETHKAPNILPYEFGNLPQYYSEIVKNGMEAGKVLSSILKSGEYENKRELHQLMKNTEKIVVYLLKNVDRILEKQTIGSRHMDDLKDDVEYED